MPWWTIFTGAVGEVAKAGADVAKEAIKSKVEGQAAVITEMQRQLDWQKKPLTKEQIFALADALAEHAQE